MIARKTNDQPLADVLQQMVHVFRLKPNLYKTKVENLWEQKMGRTIATYTRDIRMKDNILYVTIESASLRSELQFGREKIKTIMNDEIGEDYIKEVIIN
jgi:predicted nucleic acid-binding Zn ribbon protein